jgi:tripartite-type tricarboxylate transporter receptor subunit TctC
MRAVKSISVAAALAAVVVCTAGEAIAQAQQKYPSRPVRIVVGFSAGSATDITARMIAPKLSEKWGQPIVIENRPGAGGTLAAAAVAKATPDGHSLLLTSAALAITAVLNDNLPYNVLKDFAPIVRNMMAIFAKVVVAAGLRAP